MNLRRALLLTFATLVVASIAACDADPDRFPDLGPVAPSDPIPASRWLSDVNIDGVSLAYRDDEMPEGTTVAPTILSASQIVLGGSLVLSVTIEDTADELLVSVSNADMGQWHVDLASLSPDVVDLQRARGEARVEKLASIGELDRAAVRAPREIWLNITSDPEYAARGFTIEVATVEGGVASQPARRGIQINSTAAASNNLQVSLNWIHPVDMDLHVVTPAGARIYFGETQDATGGELDLDSNAGCFTPMDLIQNENITWRSETPAAGEYIVSVQLWSNCSVEVNMPYIVTVKVDGNVSTYEGFFTASQGGTPGVEITRVNVN